MMAPSRPHAPIPTMPMQVTPAAHKWAESSRSSSHMLAGTPKMSYYAAVGIAISPISQAKPSYCE
jgi:hypothetical protein